MLTHIPVLCPSCRRDLQIRRTYIGKMVCCRYCDHTFLVERPEDGAPHPFLDASGYPPQRFEVDTGSTESLTLVCGGAFDGTGASPGDLGPGSDRVLEGSRADQGWSWAGFQTVQVGPGRFDPEFSTVVAPGIETLWVERDEVGRERDRLREELHALRSEWDADTLRLRRWGEELDAARVDRERLEAERRAALDEADRLRVALGEREQSLRDVQLRHEVAFHAVARQYEQASGRMRREWDAERARWEQERSTQAQEREAATRRAEEQVRVMMAERDEARQAHAVAERSHEESLVALREERDAEREQWKERVAALSERFERDCGVLRGALGQSREEFEAQRRERDLLLDQLGEAGRERDRLAASVEVFDRRVRALETDLIDSRGQAETAREEARRSQDELNHLRQALEQAQGRERAAAEQSDALRQELEQAEDRERAAAEQSDVFRLALEQAEGRARVAAEQNHVLCQELEQAEGRARVAAEQSDMLRGQIRARQIEWERLQQSGEDERREWHQRLATLREEKEARQREWQADLDEARRQSDRALQDLRAERDRRRDEADDLCRERDLALAEVQDLARKQECLSRALGEIEAAREVTEQQLRAEIARRAAELAESERRNETIAGRNEQLSREVAELRGEQERQRIGCGTAPQPGVDVYPQAPDVLGAARNGTDPRRGGDFRAEPDRLPMPFVDPSSQAPRSPEGTLATALPSDDDLAILQEQVEMLTRLLRPRRVPEPSNPVLDPRRLSEYYKRIREASRLATKLAAEIELSPRQDEIQLHRYILRRSQEVNRPR